MSKETKVDEIANGIKEVEEAAMGLIKNDLSDFVSYGKKLRSLLSKIDLEENMFAYCAYSEFEKSLVEIKNALKNLQDALQIARSSKLPPTKQNLMRLANFWKVYVNVWENTVSSNTDMLDFTEKENLVKDRYPSIEHEMSSDCSTEKQSSFKNDNKPLAEHAIMNMNVSNPFLLECLNPEVLPLDIEEKSTFSDLKGKNPIMDENPTNLLDKLDKAILKMESNESSISHEKLSKVLRNAEQNKTDQELSNEKNGKQKCSRIFVTVVDGINTFYGQFENVVANTELWQDLIVPDKDFPDLKLKQTWKKHDFLMAMYKPDCQWYRAEIIDVIEDKSGELFYEVFFIDYGNKEILPIDRLAHYYSVKQFKTPPNAQHFLVDNIIDLTEGQECKSYFCLSVLKEKICNQTLEVEIIEQAQNVYKVCIKDEIYMKAVKDLNDLKIIKIK